MFCYLLALIRDDMVASVWSVAFATHVVGVRGATLFLVGQADRRKGRMEAKMQGCQNDRKKYIQKMKKMSNDFVQKIVDISKEQEAKTIRDATSFKMKKNKQAQPKTDVRTSVAIFQNVLNTTSPSH